MRNFIEDKQYPYGQCVLKNMELIQHIGLPQWLEMQKNRWRCEYCGHTHSWYQATCSKCGMTVESYLADL